MSVEGGKECDVVFVRFFIFFPVPVGAELSRLWGVSLGGTFPQLRRVPAAAGE